jgi:hypothetical protein
LTTPIRSGRHQALLDGVSGAVPVLLAALEPARRSASSAGSPRTPALTVRSPFPYAPDQGARVRELADHWNGGACSVRLEVAEDPGRAVHVVTRIDVAAAAGRRSPGDLCDASVEAWRWLVHEEVPTKALEVMWDTYVDTTLTGRLGVDLRPPPG